MLYLECGLKQGSTSTEAVVVAVGVNAIEHGVGIAALVQQVGELQAEDGLLQLVLRRGIEERHVFILIGGDLATHMIIVQGDVEDRDGEDMHGSAMGERGNIVLALGIARPRPTVVDVVLQLQPREGRQGHVAVDAVVAALGLENLAIDGLLTTSKAIAAIQTELGKERWDVLGGGEVETRGARTRVALQGRAADVDAANTLRIERVVLRL